MSHVQVFLFVKTLLLLKLLHHFLQQLIGVFLLLQFLLRFCIYHQRLQALLLFRIYHGFLLGFLLLKPHLPHDCIFLERFAGRHILPEAVIVHAAVF